MLFQFIKISEVTFTGKHLDVQIRILTPYVMIILGIHTMRTDQEYKDVR